MRSDLRTAPIGNGIKRMITITVGAVFFLILVGGIVRMTGSGMGCPDWPKCFGQWIPPTDVSQLPDDYQTTYKDHGYGNAEFNAFKTWTEYVNRLIGVLVGFFAVLTFAFSVPYRKKQSRITWLSGMGLLLIILQGGIGAFVVQTNLQGSLVTFHMIFALLIVAIYLLALIRIHNPSVSADLAAFAQTQKTSIGLGALVLVLVLIQVGLGTQVREEIDHLAESYARSQWIDALGFSYKVHKFFYYFVVLSMGIWFWGMRTMIRKEGLIKQLVYAAIGFIGLEVALGITMHYAAVPSWAQPLHLLLASLLFADVFVLWVLLIRARHTQTPKKENLGIKPQIA